MTITRTLLNESGETPEEVLVAPFDRSAWIETAIVDEEMNIGKYRAAKAWKLPGDDSQYPLVCVVALKSTTARYPGQGQLSRKGSRFEITFYTVVQVADSLSGITNFEPVGVQLALFYTGSIMEDPEGMLDFVFSSAAVLYAVATAGDLDLSIINGVAYGNTEIL